MRALSLTLPVLTAALLMAGCQDPTDRPAPQTSTSAAATPDRPATALFEPMIGRWQVTAIGTRPVPGLELSSDGTRIWWEPGCAGQGRAFTAVQGRFAIVPTKAPDEVCEIGVPSDLLKIWDLLDAAERLDVTGAGQVRITGKLDPIYLSRIAALPQRAAQIQPETRPALLSLAGEWRVAGIDGKDFDQPTGIALRGDARQLWWEPRCAGVVRNYVISGERIVIGTAARPSQGGARPQPVPVCAIGLPAGLDAVTRAVDGATRIRRTASNGIELSGGGHTLLLYSQ